MMQIRVLLVIRCRLIVFCLVIVSLYENIVIANNTYILRVITRYYSILCSYILDGLINA